MKSFELFSLLLLGGVIGMFGQVIRMVVGLLKANSRDESISINRIMFSLCVGFAAGGIAILTLTGWKYDFLFSHQDFVMLLTVGYSGVDFLEGIFRSIIERSTSAATNPSVSTGGAANISGSGNQNEINQLKADLEEHRTEMTNAVALFTSANPPSGVNSTDVILNFGPNADSSVVSAYAVQVIKDMLAEASILRATITSTIRHIEKQAMLMYDIIINNGFDKAKILYGNYGDQVLNVFAPQKSREENIAAMIAKIREIGPEKISTHLGDFNKIVVVDIAPSSIPLSRREGFVNVIKKRKQAGILQDFHLPPIDPAYHLEIINKSESEIWI